jgi:uncharacterized protein YqgV (UPF0045/DUF77 family)
MDIGNTGSYVRKMQEYVEMIEKEKTENCADLEGRIAKTKSSLEQLQVQFKKNKENTQVKGQIRDSIAFIKKVESRISRYQSAHQRWNAHYNDVQDMLKTKEEKFEKYKTDRQQALEAMRLADAADKQLLAEAKQFGSGMDYMELDELHAELAKASALKQ